MKIKFLAIAILISVASFSQQDTAAIRKEQEAANKFVSALITKTSIKDFQTWLIDNNVGIKDWEVFQKLYNAFIQQKFIASKSK
jgi:hypothetical protein